MRVSSTVTFFGNCRNAVASYQEIFKAEVVNFQTFKDCQSFKNMPLDQDKQHYIYRAELLFGQGEDRFSLVLADSPSLIFSNDQGNPNNRDNITFEMSSNQLGEVERIYHRLLENGKRNTPLEAKVGTNQVSGSLIDEFNICWILTYNNE